MKVGKIIRFIIIVGLFIGAYAYMANVSDKREREREFKKYQSSEAMRKIEEQNKLEKEKKMQEEKYEKELKENADNSEYQVKKWYNTYRKLKETSTGLLNRAQVWEHKNKMKEAKEKLSYWLEKRSDELTDKRDKAETENNMSDVDYYNNELEKLSEIADVIEDEEDDD